MAEKTKKKLEDLNLLDDFLMKLVASDKTVGKEFARILLGILLQREVRPLTVIPQKEFTAAGPDRHGIRLDVYLDEPGAGIFDIEPDRNRGKGQRGSLPRRARFYHSKMDSASLKSGEQYSSLRDVCVIFITDYDPFGCGRLGCPMTTVHSLSSSTQGGLWAASRKSCGSCSAIWRTPGQGMRPARN